MNSTRYNGPKHKVLAGQQHEKVRANVLARIAQFDLRHPSMMDNDFRFWRDMGNRYWPTFYLIDKRGTIRHVFVGETHAGEHRARTIESEIQILLAETAQSD